MKFIYKILALSFVLLTSCSDDAETAVVISGPRIELNGNKIDTAYLFAEYKDPGASFFEDRDGTKNCYDYGVVSEITGAVNTTRPGTYYLTYHAKDTSGNELAPITRTVVVVENRAHFLNGDYTVACSCTVVPQGQKPIVTSENYTAVVLPEPKNREFKIVSLNVGNSKLVPHSILNGDSIYVGFFSPEYDYYNTACKGAIDPAGNSFTVQTLALAYATKIKYTCSNVFTKMVAIKKAQ